MFFKITFFLITIYGIEKMDKSGLGIVVLDCIVLGLLIGSEFSSSNCLQYGKLKQYLGVFFRGCDCWFSGGTVKSKKEK